MEQTAAPRFDARDYVRIIRKRLWFVLTFAVVALFVGGIAGLSGKREFRATARVVVQQPVQGYFLAGSAPQGQEQRTIAMETQARIVKSPACTRLAQNLLQNPTPGSGEIPYSMDVAQIQDTIGVEVEPPDVLRIDAQSENRDIAIRLANMTAKAFVDLSKSYQRKGVNAARAFLEQQLTKTKLQLEQASRRATEYQRRTGLISPESGTSQLAATIESFRTEKAHTDADLADAQAAVSKLGRIVASTPEASVYEVPVANPDRASLEESLRNDRLALSNLRAQYTDQHPAVQNLIARIQQAQQQLAAMPAIVQHPQVIPNMQLGDARTALQAQEIKVHELAAQSGSYASQIAKLQVEARDMVGSESDLGRLQDEVDLAREQHKAVLAQLAVKRLEEATASEGDVLPPIEAVSAVTIGPNLLRTVVFSFFLGLFAGVALALVLETLDDTVHNPEDITRPTGTAFLGIVPWTEETADGLVAIIAPKSPPAEAYRTLRSNINFALVDSPARTFAITSAGAGEGKSSVASNLAVVLAESGQSVILVDSDLRRPILHRYFNRQSAPGLTNVLVGELSVAEVLQETEVPGLRLLAAGPLPPNPAELIDSPRMDRAIEQLRVQADIVLFDTPPAIMLTDAVIVASKVDRVILVAEAGRVTRDAFSEVVRLVQHARGEILGGILNKLKLTSSDYYYYYYYYYDGGKDTPKRRGRASQPTREPEAQAQPPLPWERPEWIPAGQPTEELPRPPAQADQQATEQPVTEPPAAEPAPAPKPGNGHEPPLMPWDRQ